MNKWLILLRGINVSGQKLIKMAELKVMFEELGFEGVKTYIQSGNVVGSTDIKSRPELIRVVAECIEQTFGFLIKVQALDVKDIRDIIVNNPFEDRYTEEPKTLGVTILGDEPDNILLNEFKEVEFPEEYVEVYKNYLYYYFPNGAGRAKLSNNFIEKKLKVNATSRNWRTMLSLAEMMND